jgi:hypothetical protein
MSRLLGEATFLGVRFTLVGWEFKYFLNLYTFLYIQSIDRVDYKSSEMHILG